MRGNQLPEILRSLRINASELARRINASPSSISKWIKHNRELDPKYECRIDQLLCEPKYESSAEENYKPKNEIVDDIQIELAVRPDHEGFINARGIYNLLKPKNDFNTWIKRRIDQYDFKEGTDFTAILGRSELNRQTTEYLCSQMMIQELGLVEGTEVGKKIRQFCIKAANAYVKEKQKPNIDNNAVQMKMLQTLDGMLARLGGVETKIPTQKKIQGMIEESFVKISSADFPKKIFISGKELAEINLPGLSIERIREMIGRTDHKKGEWVKITADYGERYPIPAIVRDGIEETVEEIKQSITIIGETKSNYKLKSPLVKNAVEFRLNKNIKYKPEAFKVWGSIIEDFERMKIAKERAKKIYDINTKKNTIKPN